MKNCLIVYLLFCTSLAFADPSKNRGQLTETLGQIIQTLGSKDFQLQITEADKKGIKRVGTDFHVAKSLRFKALLNLPVIMKEAVVRRILKSGKPYGFKIATIKEGSIYSHLGIKPGDIIKAVDNLPITTEQEAMAVFESVKTKDVVMISIERDKKNIIYNYKFV